MCVCVRVCVCARVCDCKRKGDTLFMGSISIKSPQRLLKFESCVCVCVSALFRRMHLVLVRLLKVSLVRLLKVSALFE
jgi:hypothetical protein